MSVISIPLAIGILLLVILLRLTFIWVPVGKVRDRVFRTLILLTYSIGILSITSICFSVIFFRIPEMWFAPFGPGGVNVVALFLWLVLGLLGFLAVRFKFPREEKHLLIGGVVLAIGLVAASTVHVRMLMSNGVPFVGGRYCENLPLNEKTLCVGRFRPGIKVSTQIVRGTGVPEERFCDWLRAVPKEAGNVPGPKIERMSFFGYGCFDQMSIGETTESDELNLTRSSLWQRVPCPNFGNKQISECFYCEPEEKGWRKPRFLIGFSPDCRSGLAAYVTGRFALSIGDYNDQGNP